MLLLAVVLRDEVALLWYLLMDSQSVLLLVGFVNKNKNFHKNCGLP